MTTAHAGWWRRGRTVQRLTANGSGRRGAVATKVLRSNPPRPRQARLLEVEAVGCP
jgi:hypothetical protein